MVFVFRKKWSSALQPMVISQLVVACKEHIAADSCQHYFTHPLVTGNGQGSRLFSTCSTIIEKNYYDSRDSHAKKGQPETLKAAFIYLFINVYTCFLRINRDPYTHDKNCSSSTLGLRNVVAHPLLLSSNTLRQWSCIVKLLQRNPKLHALLVYTITITFPVLHVRTLKLKWTSHVRTRHCGDLAGTNNIHANRLSRLMQDTILP